MSEINYENLMKLAIEYVKERPFSFYSINTDFLLWIKCLDKSEIETIVDKTEVLGE